MSEAAAIASEAAARDARLAAALAEIAQPIAVRRARLARAEAAVAADVAKPLDEIGDALLKRYKLQRELGCELRTARRRMAGFDREATQAALDAYGQKWGAR